MRRFHAWGRDVEALDAPRQGWKFQDHAEGLSARRGAVAGSLNRD
jgi:hypothetical protein